MITFILLCFGIVSSRAGASPLASVSDGWFPAPALRAVGKLRLYETAGGHVDLCSGTLVAPHLVLTAAHCLPPPWRNPARGIADITDVSRSGSFFQLGSVRSSIRSFVAGRYLSSDKKAVEDWAVLRIDTDLSAEFGTVPIASAPHAKLPVVASGFPASPAAGTALQADVRCSVGARSYARPFLKTDCAGAKGMSGGPLLSKQGDRWSVVGIHSRIDLEDRHIYAVPAVNALEGLRLLAGN